MEGILVGCGQITWGGSHTSPEQVMAEIAQAGYEGAPAGPDSSAEETLRFFADYGLKPAPGYLGGDFWKADQHDDFLERARRYCAFMREVGCTELYISAGGFDWRAPSGRTRREAAAKARPDDALPTDDFQRLAETVNEIGAIGQREGVLLCYHNHVGTVVETLAEVERLLELVDPALIALGPDTGHLAWAGVDVVAFVQKYASRIKTLHVKDIDPDVLKAGVAADWDYGAFSQHGIFAELGEGFVDFPTVFATLRDAGFSGWAIAETDVTQKPTALESVTISRAYLRTIGV